MLRRPKASRAFFAYAMFMKMYWQICPFRYIILISYNHRRCFMKKLLAILLSALLIFSMAACGGSSECDASADNPINDEESNLPSDINEWTGADFATYFKAQGILPYPSEDYEPYVGNHGDDWQGTPIQESAVWSFASDDPGSFFVFTFGKSGDVPDEEVEYWKECIDNTKTMPYEYAVFGEIDHMVGNIAFISEDLSYNDEIRSACEAAYQQFLKDTGLTPEF